MTTPTDHPTQPAAAASDPSSDGMEVPGQAILDEIVRSFPQVYEIAALRVANAELIRQYKALREIAAELQARCDGENSDG